VTAGVEEKWPSASAAVHGIPPEKVHEVDVPIER